MDINFKLEEQIRIIVENKVPVDEFNEFSINFYLLTKKIMISLNKFLNIRNIRNPKFFKLKILGNYFIYQEIILK